MTHERASEILDAVLKAFKGGDVNVVTRELLLYYIAVAHQRILTGQVLTHDPDSQILRYPMPNLFSPIAEALTDGHPVLDGLSEQQQQGKAMRSIFCLILRRCILSVMARLSDV